ncbi:MAG TPA: phospholipase D-like domain-containing protein [Anaerolineaceae bacterium]|nr:phospholipase D-like domain-containing protein [Anaerolineaceae bacterium]HPN50360.1 phospholipase D-like domain-containing protein [Anaerolineaceae bacterium]
MKRLNPLRMIVSVLAVLGILLTSGCQEGLDLAIAILVEIRDAQAALTPNPDPNPAATSTPRPAKTPRPGKATPTPQSSSWYDLYFTEPDAQNNAAEEALIRAVSGAKKSVDVAIYNLSLSTLSEALRAAHKKGVAVRVVMESDNMDNDAYDALKKAGVKMVGDRREALMHDKYVIIDGKEVWTGSPNFTRTSFYSDNNNLIRIRSTRLAEAYQADFNAMFDVDRFGTEKQNQIAITSATVEGTPIEIFFSPGSGADERIVELLNQAQESINFMAYSFTSDDMANAIYARAKAGVEVAGVMDASQIQSNIGTEYAFFKRKKLDVREDGNSGLMHHKVIIIDKKIVILGSYNFTASAENNNDENLLIIENSDLAAAYLAEFARLQDQAGN